MAKGNRYRMKVVEPGQQGQTGAGGGAGAGGKASAGSGAGVKSPAQPKKDGSKGGKKSRGPLVVVVVIVVVALVCGLLGIVIVGGSKKKKEGVAAQEAFDSWSSLVKSGSFDALSTANQASQDGYLYQEIQYNNDNQIFARMKQAVLSTVEYTLPEVEETGLFNKGTRRLGNLDTDDIDILRTTIDWSKVPVSRVDIQQAVKNWASDRKAQDEKASEEGEEGEGAEGVPAEEKKYVNDINSPTYAMDSAEIFAEWAILVSQQAVGVRSSQTIEKGDLLVETPSGYSVSASEDLYLDNVLFSSADFINCMNDVQNQLYLMSGGTADEATTKLIFGTKDVTDTSGMGADAPTEQKDASDGKEQSAEGEPEGSTGEGQTGQQGETGEGEGQAGEDDKGADENAEDGKEEKPKPTSKSDFTDVDLQRDGLQIYDYDTDIKGIQQEDGSVVEDTDPNTPGIQLGDGTTVEGIPVPDKEKELADHKSAVLTDFVKDRWVMDKSWVGTYRLLSGETKVIPQKGDGSFDNPATVGTRIVYAEPITGEDGKVEDIPVSVTLTEFRVGADAIKWYETKDSRNRGYDERSNSVQIAMVFTLTNLGSKDVTFYDDSSLADSSGNLTYRTGTVYGLKDSVTLKPGETGTLETWTAATAITEKYIIWGRSYMADKGKDPVYFAVLKSASSDAVSGQSAQDVAGTAGNCSNADAGCSVEGNSAPADSIPGTVVDPVGSAGGQTAGIAGAGAGGAGGSAGAGTGAGTDDSGQGAGIDAGGSSGGE